MAKALLVVDCGSGHSSAMLYERSAEDEPPRATKFIDCFPVLVAALRPGGMGAQAWCDTLAAVLPQGVPVVIGATAGVRQALETGAITAGDVERLREVLRSISDATWSLKILTGLEEAQAELTALDACARWSGIAAPCGGRVQLLSGGGKSMQLGWYGPDAAKVCASLCADSFVGTSLVEELGVVAGLAAWGEQVSDALRGQLAACGEQLLVHHLSGPFIAIEMLAWALSQTPVPLCTWMPCGELVGHLARYAEDLGSRLGEDLPLSNRQLCIVAAYSIQVRLLLELAFDSAAPIYVPARWDPLKPEWTVGLVLS